MRNISLKAAMAGALALVALGCSGSTANAVRSDAVSAKPVHFDGTTIKNDRSGKCLEVEDSSSRNGARVQQWDFANVKQQFWTFRF
ncbi:RICIN domain-containing protein [Streptomyces sp. NPDC001678]|uniref:RICIN domain-containing protein n=1 Tax=Streptomyces sp. NPDC001678 TaxID=3364599 RepID=UPI0036B3B19F